MKRNIQITEAQQKDLIRALLSATVGSEHLSTIELTEYNSAVVNSNVYGLEIEFYLIINGAKRDYQMRVDYYDSSKGGHPEIIWIRVLDPAADYKFIALGMLGYAISKLHKYGFWDKLPA